MRLFWRCLLPMLLLLSLPVWADRVATNELMVVTEEWAPYQYTTADGAVSGPNVAMVQAILAEAKFQTPIKIVPWARAFFMGKNRPNTLIFSLSRSKERENQFIWIGELMRRDDWFYRATGHDSIAPTKLSAIKSCCTVCVVRKDIVEDDLQKLGFQPDRHYITADSFADCMRLVQTGTVPLLVNSPAGLAQELKQQRDNRAGFQKVMPLPGAGQEPLYLAASIGTSATTVARLQAAIKTLQQNGTLEQTRRLFLEHSKP
ncbi:substrate-binding periplasmic protein [Paludibacterium purpuratum]|nr:transporter substrate-binding domain-containing protein [Paludibacterium purpuratum]